MTTDRLMVMLVDPSLFTAPYDAALSNGLADAGIEVCWASRPLRPGEEDLLPPRQVQTFFYRRTEGSKYLPAALKRIFKGLGHAAGLVGLISRVARQKPDVIHFQWAVIPLLDALAMAMLKGNRPVVLTVHDPVPFNGDRTPLMYRLGFELPIALADRVIVHTAAARDILVRRNVAAKKIAIVAHGPLRLTREQRDGVMRDEAPDPPRDPRWTFVLFGQIKPYKGLDLLVEAVGLMPREMRDAARFVVAGAAKMDISPIFGRIRELNLESCFELRVWRHSELEMAKLFREANAFVFPYREIDASGVYFLLKGRGKWIVATRVGIFAQDLKEGVDGDLVMPEDTSGLATSLVRAIVARPAPAGGEYGVSWKEIGLATREIYIDVIARRR